MKRSGLIALGMVAALVTVVLAAAQFSGGGPGGGAATDETQNLAVRLSGREGPATPEPYGTDAAPFLSEEPFGAGGVGGGGENVAPPLPEVAGRKLVRDATVSLSVEDVGTAVQRVETIASGAGGFVSASSVFVEEAPPEPGDDEVSPPKRTQSATVTIRVPASAYASVLGQLRDMAEEVTSESSTTSDVTEEFADLEARLRNLEATEARYLELLGKAVTIPDILTLQDRINSVRLEIELIQGRINLLNDLTDLATIVVQLGPPAAVEEPPEELGWAEEAWEDAWENSQEALEAVGTVAIVGAVVLAWLAVPALVVVVGWRLFGPRRPRGGEAGGSGGPA